MITQILAKVLPVLVMIALGRVCATKGILNDDQHVGLKNIIGDILLPVVLFQAFLTAEYGRGVRRIRRGAGGGLRPAPVREAV